MDSEKEIRTAHREEATAPMSSIGRRLFRYVEFDVDEEMIAEIRKHPLGIVVILVIGIFVALALSLAPIVFANNLGSLGLGVDDSSAGFGKIVTLVGIFLAMLALVITLISIILYRENVVFVTSEKIAEVRYLGIFNRKVTQLNIGKVEDVTVSQRGIFAHAFNFGTMLIETAGETTNPAFTMMPDPNLHSQQIIEAHEHYVEKYGN